MSTWILEEHDIELLEGFEYNENISGTSIITFTNNTGGTFTITGITAGGGGGGVSGDYLPLSGGTVTGNTIFQSGLTANTISATTYQNLPISALTAGNNISITGSSGSFTISFTGTSGSVSGLTYYVSAATPTGVTLISGDRWFDTTTGAEVVYINDGDSKQWIQPNNAAQSSSPVSYYTASTYSAMISFGTPTNMTIIKVLNDENKSVSNAIYQVWPDGVRIWMAAIQDN